MCAVARLTGADDAYRATATALANALHAGDAKAALALFDAKTAKLVRTDVERLLTAGEANLSFDLESGVWTLDIAARDVASGVTHRQAKVAMMVRGGRIESFAPADFLAPPHGREAWDAVFAFAQTLGSDTGAPAMDEFDRAMPGYGALKNAVDGLWAAYRIEPSLELVSNEGDDSERTLRITWSLSIGDQQNRANAITRQRTVECRVAKRGKSWRIVSFDAPDLFAAPGTK
jgi:hypothetical protein